MIPLYTYMFFKSSIPVQTGSHNLHIYSIYVNRQKTIVLSSSKWKLTRLCRIIIVYMYYKKESELAFFCSSISISFFLFLFFYSCNWFIHICYLYKLLSWSTYVNKVVLDFCIKERIKLINTLSSMYRQDAV